MKIETYRENGYLVFTERAHLDRGSCCGSGCRHCPFLPRHFRGSTRVDPGLLEPSRAD